MVIEGDREMKDKECRKDVKWLYEEIGRLKKGGDWHTDVEFWYDMHESTGVMRQLKSLNDRIEALEKFLGIELIKGSLFEYRKIEGTDAGH